MADNGPTAPTTCPVCGLENATEGPDSFDICPRCRWEDDGLQRVKPEFWGGANLLSLRQAREAWQAGIVVRTEHWWAHLVAGARNQDSDLGLRAEVLASLAAALPDCDLADPTWGILRRNRLFMEFAVRDVERVKSLWVHACGTGDAPGVLMAVCDHTGWHVLDLRRAPERTPGGFFDASGLAEFWHGSRARTIRRIEEQERKAAEQGKRLIFTSLTEVRSGKHPADFADIRALYQG